jgi:hypothetical protein
MRRSDQKNFFDLTSMGELFSPGVNSEGRRFRKANIAEHRGLRADASPVRKMAVFRASESKFCICANVGAQIEKNVSFTKMRHVI